MKTLYEVHDTKTGYDTVTLVDEGNIINFGGNATVHQVYFILTAYDRNLEFDIKMITRIQFEKKYKTKL